VGESKVNVKVDATLRAHRPPPSLIGFTVPDAVKVAVGALHVPETSSVPSVLTAYAFAPSSATSTERFSVARESGPVPHVPPSRVPTTA
jgi:hypothetical protein